MERMTEQFFEQKYMKIQRSDTGLHGALQHLRIAEAKGGLIHLVSVQPLKTT